MTNYQIPSVTRCLYQQFTHSLAIVTEFGDITNVVTRAVTASEKRQRARSGTAQESFEYAIAHILKELWKASAIGPTHEVTIQRGRDWYSKNSRYRDPHLTYRTTIDAFNGLRFCNYLDVVKEGYYDRKLNSGKATKVVASPKLRQLLNNIKIHPAIAMPPDLDRECIILRNRVGGRRIFEAYTDTPQTIKWRENLKTINKCLIRHWPDLEIPDQKVKSLQERLELASDKEPVNLSNRTLVRIFTNNSWEQGGRFYRAWWQNIPKELRPYITIDGKRTIEYDYSQIHPHIVYARVGAELGAEDAYNRVFGDPSLRGVIKQAFNAMLQSSTPLINKPRKLNLKKTGLSWEQIRSGIIDAHRPIEKIFFSGIGNSLQFEDSCIAEAIMLHFSRFDAPALPIHDSFIVHHGYGAELEEQMRKAFSHRFGVSIADPDMIIREMEPASNSDEFGDISIDSILAGPDGYEKYTQRERDWFSFKYN